MEKQTGCVHIYCGDGKERRLVVWDSARVRQGMDIVF